MRSKWLFSEQVWEVSIFRKDIKAGVGRELMLKSGVFCHMDQEEAATGGSFCFLSLVFIASRIEDRDESFPMLR